MNSSQSHKLHMLILTLVLICVFLNTATCFIVKKGHSLGGRTLDNFHRQSSYGSVPNILSAKLVIDAEILEGESKGNAEKSGISNDSVPKMKEKILELSAKSCRGEVGNPEEAKEIPNTTKPTIVRKTEPLLFSIIP